MDNLTTFGLLAVTAMLVDYGSTPLADCVGWCFAQCPDL